MIGFTTDLKMCRSKFIGEYFGDIHIKDCGICDNCLKKKARPLTPEEFEKIRLRIAETVGSGKISAEDFFHRMKSVPKDKLLKVLEFLQAENKLVINDRDEISM